MRILTDDNELAELNKLFLGDNPDFGRGKPKYDVHVEPESTYLNPKINSKKELVDWCLIHLGYPMLTVELTDEHFNVAIADALSLYSKYATFQTKYLAVSLTHKKIRLRCNKEDGRPVYPYEAPIEDVVYGDNGIILENPDGSPFDGKLVKEKKTIEEYEKDFGEGSAAEEPYDPKNPKTVAKWFKIYLETGYIPHEGVSLRKWRVTVVKDISTIRDRNLAIGHDDMLFGWPLLMNGQFGGLPYFGGTNAFGQNFTGSFVTYQAFYEFTSLARRIMGSNPDWRFDRYTQSLIIIPEPDSRRDDNFALLEVECEPTIEELYGEEYFRRIVLAQCKIMLGTIRSKFGSVQLIGGGQINTDIGQEGRDELKEIIDNIMRDTSIGQGFIIS